MSIEKLDTVKLIKEKIPFTIHSNYVLQNVHDYLPLAIWCYLTSLPDDWEVHRNQLMNHFLIGRDKLGIALKFLNENKLIEYIQDKVESGKFSISHIVVKNGVEFEVIHRNSTALLKNRTTDLPLSGESAPTNTIRNTNALKNKNKSFCEKDENSKKQDWKEANQEKPAWADKAKETPRADVTRQSNSYDPTKHGNKHKLDPNAPGYQAFINSNPTLKRKYQRKQQTTELSTGTTVQPKIPRRNDTGAQGASIDAEGIQSNPSPVRSAHRLLEARGACAYLEKAGLAGQNQSDGHNK